MVILLDLRHQCLTQRTPIDAAADFTCVALLATAPLLVLGAPGFAPNTLAEAIAFIRANPDKVDYGSVGGQHQPPVGRTVRPARRWAEDAARALSRHGAALTDLAAGTVQMIFTTVPGGGVISGGRVKVLGWTSEHRPAGGPPAP